MTVRDFSPAVSRMAEMWPLLTAVHGGTRTMRKAGKAYLPQWPGEETDAYQKRLSTAVLFTAFPRTCKILAAKPFSRPITHTGVPAALEELFDDIDTTGRDLHSFFYAVLENCLSHGISGVLSDYSLSSGLRTVAEERAAGARPYLVHYPAGSVLGWRATANILTSIRLLETITIETGTFKDEEIEQVRVLYAAAAGETRGRWETYRFDKNEKDPELAWKLHSSGETSRADIPFHFFYGDRIAFGCGESPLVDLAYLNVAHWQSDCDQMTALHVGRIPILFRKGFAATEALLIGAAAAMESSNKDADVKYVEPMGAALGHGRTAGLDIEERMRAIGAELLVRKTNRMTATQVESEDTAGDSTLQSMVQMAEPIIEACLRDMAVWMNEDGSSIEIEVFDEFSVNSLSDAKAQIVLLAEQQGVLDAETAFNTFKSAGMVNPELEWADIKNKVRDMSLLTTPATDVATPLTAPAKPDTAIPDMMKAHHTAMQTMNDNHMAAMKSILDAVSKPAPAPVIEVNIPEQPAPIITINPAAITVEAPVINMPTQPITINMPEQVAAPTPNVTVNSGTGSKTVTIKRSADGTLSGTIKEAQ